MSNRMIIALDGHSSSGKSTIAKSVAKALNYRYIDTGAMYRCVTLYALNQGLIQNGEINATALQDQLSQVKIRFAVDETTGESYTILNDENVEEEIRSLRVSQHVSPVSELKFVREFLVQQQRAMGKEGGIVMDGRDIGTVVFPQANLKVFVTAAPEERARRRFQELKKKGYNTSYKEVEANIRERDYIDSHRKESPLKQAEGAKVLDNTHMGKEEQVKQVLQWVSEHS